ncbi:MAG: Rieske 2Fe-2S domain-containing protein [Phormidesmis sp.]
MVSPLKVNRRQWLRYCIGSGASTVALGWLWPLVNRAWAADVDMDSFCLAYPYNSRCENYLPGVQAVDEAGKPYQVAALLADVAVGDRIPAQGLKDKSYLVIETGLQVAPYGLSAVCTHLGCLVDWSPTEQAFICPCHNSHYDSFGQVTRGPASKPLALTTVVVKDNQIGLLNQEPAENPRD